MNCIIVDDEPLAREAIEILVKDTSQLNLTGMFNNAIGASKFMEENPVDLIFLIFRCRESRVSSLLNISKRTLVIFTTAYTEYALDSYEVDATDYLIKPVDLWERFHKAVNKAIAYHSLLLKEEKEKISRQVTRNT